MAIKKLGKEITRKEDGRYLIYYTWEWEEKAEDGTREPERPEKASGSGMKG